MDALCWTFILFFFFVSTLPFCHTGTKSKWAYGLSHMYHQFATLIHTNYGYYALVARIKRSVPQIIQLNLITIQQYIKGSLFVFIMMVVVVVTITRMHCAMLSSSSPYNILCAWVNSLLSQIIRWHWRENEEKNEDFQPGFIFSFIGLRSKTSASFHHCWTNKNVHMAYKELIVLPCKNDCTSPRVAMNN